MVVTREPGATGIGGAPFDPVSVVVAAPMRVMRERFVAGRPQLLPGRQIPGSPHVLVRIPRPRNRGPS
ncbi:hypothetical protein [Actinoplanes palleronii]|uniref:hypothetical protein n=1 Tax=Actinoplanes palleronii TaxID=113570 RepID=UPI001944E704|nr:hypothetical protein [Actinoplanes palleronii]